jgi:putative membrane protein
MTKKEKSLKTHLLLYIKGIVMGTVDLVPGVSGGTIAFITGIYEELINSLKSFTPQNIKLFFTGKFKAFWEAVNATFLLVLALGIGTGILSMVKVVLYVIEHHYIATWSFFFGLILISTFSIVRTVRKFTLPLVICFGIGTAIAYFITSMSAAQTPNDLWFIFLCGVLAICALLLPGTSGSFVLLLMGKYQYILNALNTLKVDVIAVFIGGAVTGVLSFSHVLSWLLRKHHDITIALLSGFLFGSLNKIWPWKIQVNTVTGEKYAWSIEKFNDHSLSLTEQNLLPQAYENITGASANLFPAILSAMAAIAIYIAIDTIAKKGKKATSS